jgi:hypothetical protein
MLFQTLLISHEYGDSRQAFAGTQKAHSCHVRSRQTTRGNEHGALLDRLGGGDRYAMMMAIVAKDVMPGQAAVMMSENGETTFPRPAMLAA